VTPGRIAGWVDGINGDSGFVTRIEVPRDLRDDGYGLLEIAASRWREERFSLPDEFIPSRSERAITFASLDQPRVPFRVPVGNCSQWYGYTGDVLFIRHASPLEITGIRLLQRPLPR
jgi:hypothetical protein